MESKHIGNPVKYDDAIHPVVVGQRVYFGSSVDHQLYCRDLITGEELWSFATGGPIRLAPALDQGRVYFGSDDGHAYCLSADDGRLIWKLRAGPAEEWLLARGEMVSRWPVRTGLLVDDGVAYFGAGIFPHEDVYLYAVNAADGSVIWRQDYLSEQDAGRNDLSPQGYLLASDDILFVPSGGSLAAAIDRKTGALVHKRTHAWRTTAGGVVGGVQALLADGQLYASGPHHWLALEQKSGDVGFGWFDGRQLIVHEDAAYALTGSHVVRMNRQEYAVNSRRRHELEMTVYGLSRKLSGAGDEANALRKEIAEAQAELERIADVGIVWKQPTEDDAAIIAAGELLIVGGQDRVTAYAAESGEAVWNEAVEGEARGLVVAGEHLLVSTNTGQIASFATADLKAPSPSEPTAIVENPFAEDDLSAGYAQAAEAILQQVPARRGFCLVVGNQQGRLAFELAKRSELTIYAVEPDAAKVAAARAALSRAGFYGTRIIVHHGELASIPYSNYFANLIVSDSHLLNGQFPAESERLVRHLKPLGGRLILGRPAKFSDAAEDDVAADIAATAKWLEQSGLGDSAQVSNQDTWGVLVRGALPGAGDWSHQYGNPGNTAVSTDTRVRGGLGVLWYGDPGPGEVVNRHDGAVGPLATGGRLFVQGEDSILAYDAYNGLFLWRHENPKALRTGVYQNHNPANLAASNDRLFHFIKDQCLELDAATGETLRIHRLPAANDDGRFEWGYLATQGDLLVGAATIRKELDARERRRGRQTSDSTDSLFAIDLKTGKHLWTYRGKNISHHTIALGPECAYFVDSSISDEQREQALREDKSQLAALTGAARVRAESRARNADVRLAVAVDLRSGKIKWSEPVDVTDCSEIGIGGGKLSLLYSDDVLLLCGANANGHYWAQFIKGEFDRRRLVALSAADGYRLWARDANYKGRPIILGEQILAEPWSFDLRTGEQKMRQHPLTQQEVPWSLMRTGHHCGILTGCDAGMVLFRSGDTAFYDLNTDAGTRHFAGHRLGCWINAIPASGLVMIPEASAGCVCLFSIASTIVMEPREPRRHWAIHSAVGAQTPVQSLALNLGAPGDRKDADGKLWLSYPRRAAYKQTALDLDLDLQETFLPEGRYAGVQEASTAVADTERDWLYTSWAEGLRRIEIPLLGADDSPANYRVRLHFAAIDPASTDAVTFDVRVQGEPALTDVVLDPAKPAAVIRELSGIRVENNLVLELEPKQGVARLNAIEVIRNESP